MTRHFDFRYGQLMHIMIPWILPVWLGQISTVGRTLEFCSNVLYSSCITTSGDKKNLTKKSIL